MYRALPVEGVSGLQTLQNSSARWAGASAVEFERVETYCRQEFDQITVRAP